MTTAGLNQGRAGLRAGGFRRYRRDADRVKDQIEKVWVRLGRPRIFGECHIVYVRRTCPHLMDWDNLGASFKMIGDSLVKLGVIEDDSPEYVRSVQFLQRRTSKKADTGTVLVIRPSIHGQPTHSD